MKIESITVEGYKTLRDVSWTPGPLNVIIGPNASGKTNLVRALGLLALAASGQLSEAFASQGVLNQVLWNSSARQLRWEVRAELGDVFLESSHSVTYELCLKPSFGPNVLTISRELLADYHRVEKGEKGEPFKYLERDPKHAVFFDSEQRKLTAPAERLPRDTTLLSEISGVMASPELFFFSEFLKSWSIYHELLIDDHATVRKAAVTRPDYRLSADGQNLITVLHTLYTTNREFKTQTQYCPD